MTGKILKIIFIVLLQALFILGAWYSANKYFAPKIQANLQERVREVFANKRNLGDIKIAIEGRKAIVKGTCKTSSDYDLIERLIGDVGGIGEIDLSGLKISGVAKNNKTPSPTSSSLTAKKTKPTKNNPVENSPINPNDFLTAEVIANSPNKGNLKTDITQRKATREPLLQIYFSQGKIVIRGEVNSTKEKISILKILRENNNYANMPIIDKLKTSTGAKNASWLQRMHRFLPYYLTWVRNPEIMVNGSSKPTIQLGGIYANKNHALFFYHFANHIDNFTSINTDNMLIANEDNYDPVSKTAHLQPFILIKIRNTLANVLGYLPKKIDAKNLKRQIESNLNLHVKKMITLHTQEIIGIEKLLKRLEKLEANSKEQKQDANIFLTNTSIELDDLSHYNYNIKDNPTKLSYKTETSIPFSTLPLIAIANAN